MDECSVVARVAAVVGVQAQQEGLTQVKRTREEIYASALRTIVETRRSLDLMIKHEVVAPIPR
jgi:malic enzyme